MQKFFKSSWSLYLCIGVLAVISFVLLFSINNQRLRANEIMDMISFDSFYMKSQAIWLVVSFFVCLVLLLFLKKKWLQDLAVPIYIFNILILLATWVLAKDIRGSRSWLSLGGFSFQPAEFSKIAVLLFVAQFISKEANIHTARVRAIVLLAIALPAMLIIAQKEVGQVLLYFGLFVPLYVRGFSLFLVYFFGALGLSIYLVLAVGRTTMDMLFWAALIFMVVYHVFYKKAVRRNIFQSVLLGGAFAVLFFIYHYLVPFSVNQMMKPHHVRRIVSMVSINNETQDWMSEQTKDIVRNIDPETIGYNVRQAQIAIGSGGWFGKGIDQSTQTRFSFIPEQHTDFIFSALAEVGGLVACIAVFLIYLFMFYRLFTMADRSADHFSRFFIMGAYGYLTLNVFINLGMVLGVLPVVGIPLPWLSYGGSSFISNAILITLAIKLSLFQYKNKKKFHVGR